ncbi:hypothetical protein VN97_g12587, partial [Penicillium thymicola]
MELTDPLAKGWITVLFGNPASNTNRGTAHYHLPGVGGPHSIPNF